MKQIRASYLVWLRVGLPPLFAGLAVVIALGALAGFAAPSRAAPLDQANVSSVTFVLDDFDDAKIEPSAPTTKLPRNPNNFFANQGIFEANGGFITDTLTCPYTYSCYLTLDYDVSAGVTSEAGYVEELGFSYTYDAGNPATWTLRDMSTCEALSFRVMGDGILPFTSQFEIEFIGQDWGIRDQILVGGVTTGWQTKTVLLSSLTNVDPAKIKQVAVRLHNPKVTQTVGRLHFDDFALTGCSFNGNLLDLIERQAFYYFWELRHSDTGFVRDRAVDPFYNRNVTSIAAIGYELTAFGLGAERGWISRTEAASATLQVLNKLVEISPTASHEGFYYHLLEIDTGARDGTTELSTIDTALMMAGVLFAREYFTGTTTAEITIRQQADLLFNAVDWTWALDDGTTSPEDQNKFYLGWKPVSDPDFQFPAPGGGYFLGTSTNPATWDYYTDEILLINILALGSPTHMVATDTFTAWTREAGTYDGYTLYQSYFGQLFTYFIGQGWLDLRCYVEKESRIHWPHNSGLAALANRQFAIDQSKIYTTYSTQSWGLSPSLGPPNDPFTPTLAGVGSYNTYGALPKGEPIPPPPFHDGTVAPYAAAGNIAFLDDDPATNKAYQALDYWYQNQARLWGIYGFVDSFNLGQMASISDDWYAHDIIGIDQGMSLLALENYQTGFIWSVMNRSPVISTGRQAVFDDTCTRLPIIEKNN